VYTATLQEMNTIFKLKLLYPAEIAISCDLSKMTVATDTPLLYKEICIYCTEISFTSRCPISRTLYLATVLNENIYLIYTYLLVSVLLDLASVSGINSVGPSRP